MIPFSPPVLTEDDIQAVVDVLRSGWITTGSVGREFEKELTNYTGAGGTVLLNSATASLELALRLSEVGPGDEVIVPAYTYTASASVIRHVGAEIVMVDVAPDTCIPSAETLLSSVTERTKAIIFVDIAGVPYPLREFAASLDGRGNRSGAIASRLNRPVIISDAAHSLGARHDGRAVGAIADFTSFSFHAVKNLTTAEGGALQWRGALPADHAEIERRIRLLSLHGQSKDAFAKTVGSSWEYDIVELAWKCNMPDVLAALGLSQLRRYEDTIARRLEIVRRYTEELEPLGVKVLRHEGADFRSSGHLAITRIPVKTVEQRNAFIDAMREAGVATNVHYQPLPILSAYKALGFKEDDFPHAMSFYAQEVTLPLHMALSDGDVEHVIASAKQALSAVSKW